MKVEFIEELNQVQSSLENLLQKAQFQESISESEETKKERFIIKYVTSKMLISVLASFYYCLLKEEE